ncbi:asparaginase domain-containing protein [Devosia sp. A369]
MFAEGLGFGPLGTTHLPEILSQARCYFPEVHMLMLKDSLELTDEDRARLLDAVLEVPGDSVVITHGTSTMGDTARFLEGRVGNNTVVLTGAMRPFSLGMSDAMFNLGSAVASAQVLEAGVWGTMNGRIFPAHKLTKNESAGRFDL